MDVYLDNDRGLDLFPEKVIFFLFIRKVGRAPFKKSLYFRRLYSDGKK